jgi:hypothetical protein
MRIAQPTGLQPGRPIGQDAGTAEGGWSAKIHQQIQVVASHDLGGLAVIGRQLAGAGGPRLEPRLDDIGFAGMGRVNIEVEAGIEELEQRLDEERHDVLAQVRRQEPEAQAGARLRLAPRREGLLAGRAFQVCSPLPMQLQQFKTLGIGVDLRPLVEEVGRRAVPGADPRQVDRAAQARGCGIVGGAPQDAGRDGFGRVRQVGQHAQDRLGGLLEARALIGALQLNRPDQRRQAARQRHPRLDPGRRFRPPLQQAQTCEGRLPRPIGGVGLQPLEQSGLSLAVAALIAEREGVLVGGTHRRASVFGIHLAQR